MDSRDVSRRMVRAVVEAGARRVFGLPGGGNNLDFIAEARAAGVPFVLAHHETTAAMMASVYGDLTGTPGVCVVTRGPGAANAVNGAANAQLDRQPLIMITDTVSAAQSERIAHQRLHQSAMFAPVTKLSATIGGAINVQQSTATAIEVAMTHPRGAVHLDFDPAGGRDVEQVHAPSPSTPDTLAQVLEVIAAAERPVILLGVGARTSTDAVRAALAGVDAPVLMTYRAKGVVPDSWSNCAGLLTGATTEAPLIAAADLIVLIGMDSVELIPNGWPYDAPVVSLAAWPETSPYLEPKLEVIGEIDDLVRELPRALTGTTWTQGAGNAHRDAELAILREAGNHPQALTPQDIVMRTRERAPAGTIATIDAGAHMFPATTLWSVEHPDEMLISSGLATMGFALPAAIAAALARPDQRIVCFTGDGGLGMCIGELETLARLALDVTVIVFNDAALSLIAIKADPADDPEGLAVSYSTTDFAAVAEGYGLRGDRAENAQDLQEALDRALSEPGPALIDTRVEANGYPDIMHAIRGDRELSAAQM